MALTAREKGSPYEVRCPRCDVSFPVETRICIHCGGPTGQPGPILRDERFDVAVRDHSVAVSSSAPTSDSMAYRYPNESATDSGAESPFSLGGPIGGKAGGPAGRSVGDSIRDAIAESGRGRKEPNDRELETSDPPSTVAGALLRSLGGFIWVILLIGFSIARSCGN